MYMCKNHGAKKDKGNLHVLWLDLAKTYGSVPHGMLYCALEFFLVPGKLRSCLAAYFDKFRFRFSASDYTTRLVRLEKDVAMGYSISLIQFVLFDGKGSGTLCDLQP